MVVIGFCLLILATPAWAMQGNEGTIEGKIEGKPVGKQDPDDDQ